MRNIWRIFMADLKCLRTNVIAGIVVVGLLLTPSLYAWFNILGFWDPYSETGNLEVAVANEDQGYESDLIPTKINAGEQVISELRGNDEFKWEFTSGDEAIEGVKSGKYYAALVIPESFSADLLTIFSGNVKHADIEYYINQKENAVAPKVTERGADQLSTAINQEFTKAIAEVALGTTSHLMDFVGGDGLTNFATRLNQDLEGMVGDLRLASEQAENFGELMDATAGLSRSTGGVLEQLGGVSVKVQPVLEQTGAGFQNGIEALNTATGIANQGVLGVEQGLGQIEGALDGTLDSLKPVPGEVSGAVGSLEKDLGDLQEALAGVKGRICGIGTGGSQGGDGSGGSGTGAGGSGTGAENSLICGKIEAAEGILTELKDLLGKLAESEKLTPEQIDGLQKQIEQKISEAEEALDGLKESYNREIAEEIARLKETLERTSGTVSTLAGELDQMTGEMDGVADNLANGLNTAGDVMRRTADLLTRAADTLEGEREKLSLAMATGDLQKVREIIGGSPETLAQFVSAPTKLERIPVYGMANNGSAMTPFYTSLAIWVGSIFMVALMETEVGKRQIKGVKPAELYLGRYLIFLTFAILQATIVCFGDVFFLVVQCDNIGLFFLTGWVCALVFSLIVYTLTLSFSKVGESLAIILVVLQVASAGGIFPVVLSAPIFQAIYPWLPFVYSMNAFQGAMAGVYGDQFMVSILTLLAFTLPMLVLGLVLRRPVIRLNDKMLEKMEETGVM